MTPVPVTPAVVFIGSPSLDQVTHADGSVRDSIGGAAFISALAARWTGASTGVVARVPTVLPAPVAAAFGPGGLDRRGLRTDSGTLPTFHIAYDADDRATYTRVDNGLEHRLVPQDLPEGWQSADTIHLAPIGEEAGPQLRILEALRSVGATARISAGTYRRMVERDLASAQALMAGVDVFFCNAEEFALLCPDGPPADTTLCVTHGPDGVVVHQGGEVTRHPVPATAVVDATGAGDAFCGGYLAGLALGTDPVPAGQRAAAHVLGGRGAGPLLAAVSDTVGPRVQVVPAQVARVGQSLARHARSSAFDFAAPPHLPAGHPMALSMLCISTFHQFGFWTGTAEGGWSGPMYASLDGHRYKGSDFIWAAFARAARERPELLDPARMAAEPESFLSICRADDGTCPLPHPEAYVRLHRLHGAAMTARWPGGYAELVAACNATPTPIASLLDHLGDLPGYAEDPLRKKANLLAIILANRPEGFLDDRDREHIEPIVDYHLMRGCLRTGCVELLDPDLARRVDARQWVDAVEEQAIRDACHSAIAGLVRESRTSVPAVDGFFFALGRKTCLETEPPRCDACVLESCARAVGRFQPVFRTTTY